MPFADENAKFASFDALGPAGQEAEFKKFKDPVKKVAFSDAYKTWKAQKDHGFWGSMGHGAGQGVTFGFGDEAAGTLQAGLGAVLPESLGGYRAEDKRSFAERRRAEIEGFRADDEEAQRAHPGAYLTGEIGGGIAATATLPVTGAWDTAALVGSGMGAAAGLGNSKADLTSGKLEDWKRAGVDTAIGAGIGGTLGAAGPLIGRGTKAGLEWLGEKTSASAALQAFKAAHPTLTDFKKVTRAKAIEIGRQLLNEDAVNFGSSATNIAENTAPLREASGEALGGIRKKLSAARPEGLPVDAFASDIETAAGGNYPANADRASSQYMKDEAASLREAYQDKPFDFTSSGQEKTAYWKKGYKRRDAPIQETERAISNRFIGHSIGETEKGFALSASPELANELGAEAKRFSNLAPADDIAEAAAAREMRDKGLSLTDATAAVAGTLAGGPIGGLALGAANHVLKSRGTSMGAVVLNNIARYAGNEDVSGPIARAMLKNPERFGKYLPDLIKAAGRSEEAFKAISEKIAGLPDF